jgi:integrase
MALVKDGVDPIEARSAKRVREATASTVQEACEAYIEAQRPRFKTQRHVDQMRQRLSTYVYPRIGGRMIADIGLAEIEAVLTPIWQTKNRTAMRVRQYLENAIDWSIAKKIRSNDSNPAEVKKLRFVLPFGIRETKHRASLPYDQAPSFMAELRATDGIKARCLEFVMLCAVRIGDIVGGGKEHSEPMKWSHVDLAERVWVIPDTKMSKSHSVPLSSAAVAVLVEMRQHRDAKTNFVFPGASRGSCIADSTLRYLIYDMGYKGLMTTHGARACFRTWASECTDYPKDIIEMALAHAQSELDQAYMRGNFLAKRRALMSDWASFLEGEAVSLGDNVTALRA